MLEHSHADHPTYIRPVSVEYVGAICEEDRALYEAAAGEPPASDEAVRDMLHESHALIFDDGYVAVTLYECCYAMWSLRSGKPMGGRHVSVETHRLVMGPKP